MQKFIVLAHFKTKNSVTSIFLPRRKHRERIRYLAVKFVLELKVAPSDTGKVIGKQGRIAKSIRAVVKAAATKEDKKVIVDIM